MESAPPAEILDAFDLARPRFVMRTGLASIWRVDMGGEAGALKLYHTGRLGNEAAGLRYMRATADRGSVPVLAARGDALVTRWLPGPSLGDLVRGGQDRVAASALLVAARRLHSVELPAAGYPLLSDWFKALFALRFGAGIAPGPLALMERSQALAYELLSHPRGASVLHGDLHHDNIRLGARTYQPFDAKGVVGERGYELANAFRNPSGAGALLRDPMRALRLAEHWGAGLGEEPQRLLDWAAVKAALSIAWKTQGALRESSDFPVLAALWAARDRGV
ncbi:phosphotransferase [Alphaproteobacteria bacterium KMM 3653]|uniref:Phosphotransferase n=1 Tax=Harenicola maris TaxID=2841044 RepID=A0AAP2CML8_9RHOB|nr:phosphotransferase [Harenicola maris]